MSNKVADLIHDHLDFIQEKKVELRTLPADDLKHRVELSREIKMQEHIITDLKHKLK